MCGGALLKRTRKLKGKFYRREVLASPSDSGLPTFHQPHDAAELSLLAQLFGVRP